MSILINYLNSKKKLNCSKSITASAGTILDRAKKKLYHLYKKFYTAKYYYSYAYLTNFILNKLTRTKLFI